MHAAHGRLFVIILLLLVDGRKVANDSVIVRSAKSTHSLITMCWNGGFNVTAIYRVSFSEYPELLFGSLQLEVANM